MSLRAFHFVFIFASIILCVGVGILGINSFLASREPVALIFGVGSSFTALGLIAYGIWFFKKARKIII